MPLCVRHSDHLFAQLVNDTKNRPLLTQEPLKRFGLGQRTELAVELELFIGIELLRRMLGRRLAAPLRSGAESALIVT